MSDRELCYLSASEALDRFRSRRLSPKELMEATIRRARSLEPHINAFADRYFDEAMARATEAESRYARGRAVRTLEGLPFVVKDDAGIEGRRNTQGSMLFADHVATRTDPHVQRLIDAGAIVHARTTCSEFCSAWVTYTKLYGVTRCPWNLQYTPGGSSGGSAASVAAGTTVLATGSDNAGSIRQPASICGVVGYKPPYGRNPCLPIGSHDHHSVVGPLARTVADAALMQNVTSGPHPVDISSYLDRVRLRLAPGSIEDWRIAYSEDLDYFAVHPDVRRNLRETIAALRDEGAEVEAVSLGWTADIEPVCMRHYDHFYGGDAAEHLAKSREDLTDYSVYYAERKLSAERRDYGEIVRTTAHMWESLGRVLASHQAFICPTVCVPSIPATMRPDESLEVEGQRVNADFGWCMTYPFNMLGQLPVLAVPSGMSGCGVPTGVQVVARPNDDARVFRVAAAIERARPWDYRGTFEPE